MKWTFGAEMLGSGKAEFHVWNPLERSIELKLLDSDTRVELSPYGDGIWGAVTDVVRNEHYIYQIRDRQYPDPASRFQPDGVHGPSMVVDHSEYVWKENEWKGGRLEDYVLYELHTGTYTQDGTYNGIAERAGYLSNLGITAVEIMPLSQFPGRRNWGYDGVFPYAPQNSYGSVDDLKKLVDTLHGHGMDVVLDVVYNHLGPEGNYLPNFGPFFTGKYTTPWGDAINYDDAYSDGVRRFFIENALYWIDEFRFDALRLDAIHGIFDTSPKHILHDMKTEVNRFSARTGRNVKLIAESDLNDPVVVRGQKEYGYGLDAQWNDDYHHAIHSCVTGERSGYYSDYGRLDQIAKALNDGFVYDGQYSPYWKKKRGAPLTGISLHRLVTYSQNHDQVGNRAKADRLLSVSSREKAMASAALVILSPFTPLIFMGEEYGETSPFNYFIDTSDPALAKAVREGRSREFRSFGFNYTKDPNDVSVFLESRLEFGRSKKGPGRSMLTYYRDLISIRKAILEKEMKWEGSNLLYGDVISMNYASAGGLACMVSFSDMKRDLSASKDGSWHIVLRSSWEIYGGTNQGHETEQLNCNPFEVLVLSTDKSLRRGLDNYGGTV